MNKFKETLKVIKQGNIQISKKDRKKEIDEEISATIARRLLDMVDNPNDEIEWKQILNRMLSINTLFDNDFDEEMKILKEKREKKKQTNQHIH